MGDPEKLNIDLTISKRVMFLFSATSFCWGILRIGNWDKISFSNKYPTKSAGRYSRPQSDRRALILLPNYFFISLETLWAFQEPLTCDASGICIRTLRNHLMKVMKYSKSPLALTLIGPHTPVCTNFIKSLAILPLIENELFVILPSRQDLQTSTGSTTNEGKIRSFTSLSILSRLMLDWAHLTCIKKLCLISDFTSFCENARTKCVQSKCGFF